MNKRTNLKRHKEVMNEITDIVLECKDGDDAFAVEIICRKLLKLGYLQLNDGMYSRSKYLHNGNKNEE